MRAVERVRHNVAAGKVNEVEATEWLMKCIEFSLSHACVCVCVCGFFLMSAHVGACHRVAVALCTLHCAVGFFLFQCSGTYFLREVYNV